MSFLETTIDSNTTRSRAMSEGHGLGNEEMTSGIHKAIESVAFAEGEENQAAGET